MLVAFILFLLEQCWLYLLNSAVEFCLFVGWLVGFRFGVWAFLFVILVCVGFWIFFLHESPYFVFLTPTSTKQLKASKYQDTILRFSCPEFFF